MKLLNKLTLKSLRLNKVRTAVTIIGIMLSAALITVVSGMALSGRQTMIDAQMVYGGNYDVVFDITNNAKIDEIRHNRNVESAYYRERLGYAEATNADDEYCAYTVLGLSKDAYGNLFKINLEEGKFPTNSSEAVVTRAFKTQDGKAVKVGDKITLDVGILTNKDGEVFTEDRAGELFPKEFKECNIIDKSKKTYTVTGIIEKPQTGEIYNPSYLSVVYTASDEKAPAEAVRTKNMNKLYVLYTPQSESRYHENTNEILGYSEGEDWSQDIYSDPDNNAGIQAVDYNSPLLSMKGYSGSDATNRVIFGLALIIIIIVMVASVFVIRNSFAISITEKTSMYGMLASVGATKRQIRRNMLFEGFILGLIGIPLGILLGLGVNALLITVLNSVIGDMLDGATFVLVTPIIPIICAIILSAVTIFLSSIFIALRASRIPPLVAIRGNKDIKDGKNKPYRTSKLTKKLFGVGGEIASKSLKRSRKKYRTTVISIVISVAMFIAVSAFMDYGMAFTEHYYSAPEYNYIASGADLQQAQKIEKMSEITDYFTVAAKFAYLTPNADVNEECDELLYDTDDGDKELFACYMEFEHDTFVEICKELGLDYDKVKDGAIVYNKANQNMGVEDDESDVKLVDLFDKTAPTKLKVRYNDEEGDEIKAGTLNVSAMFNTIPKAAKFIVDDYSVGDSVLVFSEVGVMPSQLDNYKSSFTIYANAKENHESLTTRIESLPGTEGLENEIYITDYEMIVNQFNAVMLIVGIFVYGFIGVISLIGLTNIFNTISTNMQLRSKEFASLKSIGMTKKEFNRMIRLESLMYGIKSLIIGIPLGIAGVIAIFSAFSEGNVPMSFVFPWKAILISIAAVFIVVWLIMKYSISKVNKQNIIETIRNDNI